MSPRSRIVMIRLYDLAVAAGLSSREINEADRWVDVADATISRNERGLNEDDHKILCDVLHGAELGEL